MIKKWLFKKKLFCLKYDAVMTKNGKISMIIFSLKYNTYFDH